MWKLLAVGLGGALGAILRYLISLLPLKGSFPVWTLLTNLLGAVAIGFIAGASGPWQNAGCSGSLLENRGLRRVYHLFHLFARGVFSFGKRQQRVRGSLHPAQHSALLGRNCPWTGCRRRTAENGRYITAKADIQKRRELRHAAGTH